MFFRKLTLAGLVLAAAFASCSTKDDEPDGPKPKPEPEPPVVVDPKPVPGSTDKIVVGYVTSWSTNTVRPEYVTHINYAFGHIQSDFRSISIENDARLKTIVNLKKNASHLKVLLSIGGWGSGNFSEMAADEANRKAFASNCSRIINQYGLDGIDIDWEYPTSSAAEISSSPDDTKNFTLMMRDIRNAIGNGKLLTLATICSGDYIDFKDIMPYVDHVNIMCYDIGTPPQHNAALYQSSMSGWYNGDKAVKAHLAKGVPADKLVLGMPFYGHGTGVFAYSVSFRNITVPAGYTDRWDDDAKVPYITDSTGKMVLSYDNALSIGYKCDYILENGLHGAMFWEDAGDDDAYTLHRAIANKLFVSSK